jgi:hypothetical protein
MTNHESGKGTLALSGTGRVEVTPDVATVRLTIVTERKTAAEAVAENAQRAASVVDRLHALGIGKGDVTTAGLNLYPVYQTDQATNAATIVGYRASNTIAVEAPIDLAGKVFDAGVEAGADESSGLSFGIKNPRPHREKALELAVANARAEAELVAKAMGVRLLHPKSIDVGGESAPIRFESVRLMARAETPVLPGSLSVSASVQVTFEIAS